MSYRHTETNVLRSAMRHQMKAVERTRRKLLEPNLTHVDRKYHTTMLALHEMRVLDYAKQLVCLVQ